MPDGIFSCQKSQFGNILEGLEMESVDVFNSHMDIVTPLGNFVVT
jgi:hypothetical protein